MVNGKEAEVIRERPASFHYLMGQSEGDGVGKTVAYEYNCNDDNNDGDEYEDDDDGGLLMAVSRHRETLSLS